MRKRGFPALRAAARAERRVANPLGYFRRRGWEDGLLGGDTRWLVAGAAAWGVWVVQWAWRKEPQLVYRTRLQPGESLRVDVRPRSPRRSRR